MTEAQQVATALKGRRSGAGWVCRCPVHDDHHPSLTISSGAAGRLLVKCFAGCSAEAVLAELQRRGIIAGQGSGPSPLTERERERLREEEEQNRQRRIETARDIWGQCDLPPLTGSSS